MARLTRCQRSTGVRPVANTRRGAHSRRGCCPFLCRCLGPGFPLCPLLHDMIYLAGCTQSQQGPCPAPSPHLPTRALSTQGSRPRTPPWNFYPPISSPNILHALLAISLTLKAPYLPGSPPDPPGKARSTPGANLVTTPETHTDCYSTHLFLTWNSKPRASLPREGERDALIFLHSKCLI